MTADEARALADQALEQLADALKHGKSEQLIRYLTTLGRFHRYSFGNVMLILLQRPDATQVAGFTTWKQMGRHVKKGERGIVIIAPMTIKRCDDDPEKGETAKPILRFRIVHVFDVSQTDGEALPDPFRVQGDPKEHLERLGQFIASLNIMVDHDDVPLGADGVSRGGRISIRSGLEPATEFSVTVHELAHELLHRGQDRPPSKTIRETEAEAVAFVVCTAIGLDSRLAASDYIQLFDGKSETLAGSLDRIQKTACQITTAIVGARQHELAR